jgi:hypothetical protein
LRGRYLKAQSASTQQCNYAAETGRCASAFSRRSRHLRTRQSVCSSSREIEAGRNRGRRLARSAAMANNRRDLNIVGSPWALRRYSPVPIGWYVLRSTGSCENIRREPLQKRKDLMSVAERVLTEDQKSRWERQPKEIRRPANHHAVPGRRRIRKGRRMRFS